MVLGGHRKDTGKVALFEFFQQELRIEDIEDLGEAAGHDRRQRKGDAGAVVHGRGSEKTVVGRKTTEFLGHLEKGQES